MAEPIPVNPSPKARYLSDATVVRRHKELTQSGIFQHAVDMALLQFQVELSQQKVDGVGAAANHFKVTGALEFVNLLKGLAETPLRMPARKDRDNLTQV